MQIDLPDGSTQPFAHIDVLVTRRLFVELLLMKLIKWTVKLGLKRVCLLSRQYVDDVRLS